MQIDNDADRADWTGIVQYHPLDRTGQQTATNQTSIKQPPTFSSHIPNEANFRHSLDWMLNTGLMVYDFISPPSVLIYVYQKTYQPLNKLSQTLLIT